MRKIHYLLLAAFFSVFIVIAPPLLSVFQGNNSRAFAADAPIYTQQVPIRFPANTITSVKSIDNIDLQLPKDFTGNIKSTKLYSWGDLRKVLGASSLEVADGRQVYEVVIDFNNPIQVIGGKIAKGTIHRVIDAETGQILGSTITNFSPSDFTDSPTSVKSPT